jgi:hypothetical protein
MTDKDLLEKAAKAAGIEIEWYAPNVEVWDFAQIPNWNPLIDDGDALRLAVKLKMSMVLDSGGFKGKTTWVRAPQTEKTEYHESDPYAATRRAIVRAAAAISEQS